MIANEQYDAQGKEYNNTSSVLSVHDTSSAHPWFATLQHPEHEPLYPIDSDSEDDHEADYEANLTAATMQIDESK